VKKIFQDDIRFRGVAVCALALFVSACSSPSTSGGSTGDGTGGAGTGTGGGGRGGTRGTATGGAGASSTGGTGPSTSGTGGVGTGGASPNGTGGSAPATGGAGTNGTGGSVGTPGAGGSSTIGGGGIASTAELIGPSAAVENCGAANATHGDGFVCVLNYMLTPTGPNVPNFIGYWFDYSFSANTCTVSFTKPAGNNATDPEVCFSGSACEATSGGGLGVALCDVHTVNVSTWTQLKMLESANNLSSTAKSPFSGCNPGETMTSVGWTVSSGSIPAGTSVLFDDAADVDVTRVDLAAGATSVTVPAGVDASKVASIKFSVDGSKSTSWHFCLSSLKLSMD
jgi:hypothetical protein